MQGLQSHIEFDERGIPMDVRNIASGIWNKEKEPIDLANELYTEQLGDITVVDDLKHVFELRQLARSVKDKDKPLHKLYVALRARAESTWQTFDVNREAEQFIKPAQAAADRGFKVIVFGHHAAGPGPISCRCRRRSWLERKRKASRPLVQFVEDLRLNQLDQ
jgi:hypothetical protein